MVSIIIPAFNESKTIGPLVRSLVGHPSIAEIIVVDDGSTDTTVQQATDAGARVIRMEKNGGKGAAMDRGVSHASSDIILFLDADLAGITHQKISRIINPVLENRYDMYIGILSRRNYWLNRILHIFPILAGTRAVRRTLWDVVPLRYKKGFQIEIALNYFSRTTERHSGFEVVGGISHAIKEKKHGLLLGMWYRLIMIGHIISISFQLYIVFSLKQRIRSLFGILSAWTAS